MDVFDPNPINVNLAQSTPVIKISSLLSIEEVTAITAWGETEFDQSKESSGWELRHWDGSWKVAFLSKNNDFNTRFPNTIAKIKEHNNKTDTDEIDKFDCQLFIKLLAAMLIDNIQRRHGWPTVVITAVARYGVIDIY